MVQRADPQVAALLKAALSSRGYKQSTLAKHLHVSDSDVSRWVTGKAHLPLSAAKKIDEFLGSRLAEVFETLHKHHELYMASPITGLLEEALTSQNKQTAEVVRSVRKSVRSVYWPGELINRHNQLKAADIATAENLKVLVEADAFLYLQFEEVTRPTGALIELGMALGMNIKTTIILKRGLPRPFMLTQNFPSVAKDNSKLPDARIYEVETVAEACLLIEQTGREIFGLNPVEPTDDQPQLTFPS